MINRVSEWEQIERSNAATQPVPLGEMQLNATRPALKLLVKGFNSTPMERRLLEGTVLLSQRRQPRLDLLSDADDQSADVVMIDALDSRAMQWAASQSWLNHKAVIWVDGQAERQGHIKARRPVQWPILPLLLARALEHGPQKNTDAQQVNQRARSRTIGSNRQVLVVDDSLAVRAYLRSLLESRGLEVAEAESAEIGMAAAAATPYACILMDVLMPGIDGYEACRRIKAGTRSDRAPAIVMLTSKTSAFDRIRGKMAGCDAYLTKPINPNQLYEVLLNYVQVLAKSAASPLAPALHAPQRLAI
jgi:two-component system, cell cycle response regulator